MNLEPNKTDFLNSFDHIWTKSIDIYDKNKLNLFSIKINSNEFDYNLLKENLMEPLLHFSLSRMTKESYKGKIMALSSKAREKFRDYINNQGELGELLLYSFLETHLKAPKILTKLELKTSKNNYVNGADGVHLLQLNDEEFQLIFGESKTIKDLTFAISDAFKSIYNFKNEINEKGKEKSGINHEKFLINRNLSHEALSIEQLGFLEKILYPKDTSFNVDDAFGIFIGYEIKIDDDEKMMRNDEFRKFIKNKVSEDVGEKINHIKNKIKEYNLYGHNFYIYVLPFTNLTDSRKKILKGVLK